eukprot:TRINITY_DN20256_c0_g1_i7.p1 TRINITY_DN20256_c0_g1~~TRINITY_DN20256_c0_g1_i7.p1  ORF type:complete len:569 (-),score=110.03 TRINITY_DN20256_c0_g1_i7:37-1518(-)
MAMLWFLSCEKTPGPPVVAGNLLRRLKTDGQQGRHGLVSSDSDDDDDDGTSLSEGGKEQRDHRGRSHATASRDAADKAADDASKDATAGSQAVEKHSSTRDDRQAHVDQKTATVDAKAEGDKFRLAMVIEPQELQPYYLIFLAAFAKMGVTLVIFGPPRGTVSSEEGIVGKLKALGAASFRLGLVGLAIYTYVADFNRCRAALSAASSIWDRVWCLFLCLALSPNLNNTIALDALSKVFIYRDMWQRASERDESVNIAKAICLADFRMAPGMQELVGLTGTAYFYILVPYKVMLFLVNMFAGFASLAYCWLWFLLMLLGLGFQKISMRYLSHRFSSNPQQADGFQIAPSNPEGNADEPPQDLSDKEKRDIMIALVYGADALDEYQGKQGPGPAAGMATFTEATGMPSAAEYDLALRCYKEFGTTPQGIMQYIGGSVLPLVITPLAIIVAVRFCSGHGYWASLWTTLTERHIATYSQGFVHQASIKLHMLQLIV